MPLSLAMDSSELDHGCGGGSGGGSGSPAVAAAAAVPVADNKDRRQWCLMAVAALHGGHATTNWCSKRAAKQEDKRAAQGEAMQQPANLLPCCHYDMQHCHLPHHHGITRHCCLPHCHGNMRHCLWLHSHGNRWRRLWLLQ